MALLRKSVESGARKGAKEKAAANDDVKEEKANHKHKRAARKRRAA